MHIAVIGAGLTGCITALGFADRGHRVTIFERASRLLSRASTANEGKIHLGYVYSADPSFHTAERLIDDALLFRPLVERWISAATRRCRTSASKPKRIRSSDAVRCASRCATKT